MANAQVLAFGIKLLQATSLLTGVMLTAYNLISFKVVKNGYYFHDENQIWFAIGVTAITTSFVIKNWKNL